MKGIGTLSFRCSNEADYGRIGLEGDTPRMRAGLAAGVIGIVNYTTGF